MTNGNGNGQIQVNPQEAARTGLMFLSRCDLKPHERGAFGAVEALLNAIAEGTVQLTQPETLPAPDAPVIGGTQTRQ